MQHFYRPNSSIWCQIVQGMEFPNPNFPKNPSFQPLNIFLYYCCDSWIKFCMSRLNLAEDYGIQLGRKSAPPPPPQEKNNTKNLFLPSFQYWTQIKIAQVFGFLNPNYAAAAILISIDEHRKV